MLEGGVGAAIYENYIYQTLISIRNDPLTWNANVVLFMDNAIIHKHASVLETARKLKINVLFNAEYSSWLNPIEYLFAKIKFELRKKQSPPNM